MSARLLSRRLARLRPHAPSPRSATLGRSLGRSRSLQSEYGDTQQQKQLQQEETVKDEEEERREEEKWCHAVVDYALSYNPAAYVRPQVGGANTKLHQQQLGQSELQDAVSTATTTPPSSLVLPPPALRSHSNPYSISSSRYLSISNNTLLELAFGGREGARDDTHTPNGLPLPTEPPVDPRAFQRCRPEYRNFTHQLSSSRATETEPLSPQKATRVLKEVAVLRGVMTPGDIVSFLATLARVEDAHTVVIRGDSRFSMLLRYSVEALESFSNSELLSVLRSLTLLRLPPSHTVLELYESECVRRVVSMETCELLLAGDLWRCLGRTVTRYLEQLSDHMTSHLGELDTAQMVQLVYLLGEGRRCPAPLLGPLEGALLSHMEKLHAEEIGVVCLGLFKAQCVLSPAAVRRLVDSGAALVADMSDYALVNVMKLLRFSHLDHLSWLDAMATEMPRRAHGMGVQGLMHVALSCSALHYRDYRILMPVARRVPELAARCRSKDAAKLLWAFGTLGVGQRQAGPLYSSLTQVIRHSLHQGELLRYPQHLLTALLGLAFARHFPKDLLAAALGPEVARTAAASPLELRKDLLTLDGCVELEVPGWSGPRLGREERREVQRQLWAWAQEDVCRKHEVLEAEAALCVLLGGDEFVRKHMILPHTRSIDLEIRLDTHGRPISLVTAETGDPQEGSEEVEGDSSSSGGIGDIWGPQGPSGVTLTDDLLAQLTHTRKPIATTPQTTPLPTTTHSLLNQTPPAATRSVQVISERDDGVGAAFSVGVDLTEDLLGCLTKPKQQGGQSTSTQRGGITRIAVQVSNRNHYCYRTRVLLGLHALKRRQLVLSGYRVVELPHWEWVPLLRRGRGEQVEYLRSKIFNNHTDIFSNQQE